MKVLFIDTHSEVVRTIVKLDDKMITEESKSERSHSEVIVPTLKKVLERAEITVDELDEIIVVNGPGSFTGVRLGVTIAKGIAFCKKIPIKTITSLEMFGVSASVPFNLVTIEDSKGVYSATYSDGKFDDFSYRKKSEFEEYRDANAFDVLTEKNVSLEKIIEYLKDVQSINPHLVNPIYIKEIDALK